jgi:hypothetical protein
MGTPPVGVYFKSSQTFKDDCETLTSDSAQPDIKRINPIAIGRNSFICKPYTIKDDLRLLNLSCNFYSSPAHNLYREKN